MSDRREQIVAYMRGHADEFRAWRHQIHRHPELAFEEHATSRFVAEQLRSWGYEVACGLAVTGVVGTLRRGNGEKRLGLRADMDALPIQERTGLPYASGRPGIMHACGHDGHTTMLLAAARCLAEQGRFDGTLKLIFQPGEEAAGGAKRMMDEGLFEQHPCDAVFAMHNAPGEPQGRLLFRAGPVMASSDYVTVTLHGTGGHGGMPHRANNPIVAAASLVMALQTIVAQNRDPAQTAILSFGAINAGDAHHVIPDSVALKFSVRALERETRSLMESRVREMVDAHARSFGMRAELDYRHGYPVLVNWPEPTQLAYEAARAAFGPEHCEADTSPVTASEDFAFMLEKVPGCYLFIGNGAGEGSCMVHHPGYDFHDDNLITGPAYWVALAEHYLRPQATASTALA